MRVRASSLVIAALVIAALAPLVGGARADEPTLTARIEALGSPREDEREVYAQLERVLEEAQRASEQGDAARVDRLEDLASAWTRKLEVGRRIVALGAELERQRAALREAELRLERAREASRQSETDRARLEAAR